MTILKVFLITLQALSLAGMIASWNNKKSLLGFTIAGCSASLAWLFII